MGIPQILMIFIMGFSLISGMCRHGKAKYGFYDARETFVGLAIEAVILYAGGFWSQ